MGSSFISNSFVVSKQWPKILNPTDSPGRKKKNQWLADMDWMQQINNFIIQVTFIQLLRDIEYYFLFYSGISLWLH